MLLSIVAALAVLVLLCGGLVRRRLPARKVAGLALLWLGIIVAVWLAASIVPRLR